MGVVMLRILLAAITLIVLPTQLAAESWQVKVYGNSFGEPRQGWAHVRSVNDEVVSVICDLKKGASVFLSVPGGSERLRGDHKTLEGKVMISVDDRAALTYGVDVIAVDSKRITAVVNGIRLLPVIRRMSVAAKQIAVSVDIKGIDSVSYAVTAKGARSAVTAVVRYCPKMKSS